MSRSTLLSYGNDKDGQCFLLRTLLFDRLEEAILGKNRTTSSFNYSIIRIGVFNVPTTTRKKFNTTGTTSKRRGHSYLLKTAITVEAGSEG